MLTFVLVFVVLVCDGANFCIPLSLIGGNNFFAALFLPFSFYNLLDGCFHSYHRLLCLFCQVGWVPAHLTHLTCLL